MVKVIAVIFFLFALYFVIQGILEVSSASDLFERSDNESDVEAEDTNE